MRFKVTGKFNNKKMETPDGVFDSKGEWQRWLFLKDAQSRGEIKDLQRQVKFVLLPTQYREEVVHLKTKDKVVKRVAEREVTYTADFVYRKKAKTIENKLMGHMEIWERVVEDFKGFPNDRWPIKKAMMLYLHGVAIREVKKPCEPIQ